MSGPRSGRPVPIQDIDRPLFWSKVDRRGPVECWAWLAGCGPKGRGMFAIKTVDHYAPRVSLAMATGEPLAGVLVCHTCDNPNCVNPGHLYAGTALANVEDRQGRNRHNTPRGEDHHAARLTNDQVRNVRRRAAAGTTTRELADEHGVSFQSMWRIVKGRAYGSVT